MHIGAQVDPISGWNYYSKTLIDELSIYSRALGAAEIQAIYQADSAGKCPPGVAPAIIAQPASQSVLAGSNATFTVTAAGAPPLSYQWRFNGTNIAGATATALILANVQPAQAGSYSVRVTNTFGSVISSNAVLAVIPAWTNVRRRQRVWSVGGGAKATRWTKLEATAGRWRATPPTARA